MFFKTKQKRNALFRFFTRALDSEQMSRQFEPLCSFFFGDYLCLPSDSRAEAPPLLSFLGNGEALLHPLMGTTRDVSIVKLRNPPPTLEQILYQLSSAPFMITVSDSTSGRLDLWCSRTSLKNSASQAWQLPSEPLLVELFRQLEPLTVKPVSINRSPPKSVGLLVSEPQLSIQDFAWDAYSGAFFRGSPRTATPPNVSSLFCPFGRCWTELVKTELSPAFLASLPDRSAFETSPKSSRLSLRTALLLSSEFKRKDLRCLTVEALQKLDFLELHTDDYKLWFQETDREDPIRLRVDVQASQIHGFVRLRPRQLRFKALAVHSTDVPTLQHILPAFDWGFVVTTSSASWSSCSPTLREEQVAIAQLSAASIAQTFHTVGQFQPLLSATMERSWQVGGLEPLLIRETFYEISPHELSVFKGHHPVLASFGLAGSPPTEAKAKLLLYKQGGVLASELLEECFSGFLLQSAQTLMSPSKPECVICAARPCTLLLDTCGHTFCMGCICTHQTMGGTTCPACQTPLAEEESARWTTPKRMKAEKKSFSKETHLASLTRQLRGSILVIVPSEACLQVARRWSARADIEYATLESLPESLPNRKIDHFLLASCLVESQAKINVLDALVQGLRSASATLHILRGRAEQFTEEADWIPRFVQSYPRCSLMSCYV